MLDPWALRNSGWKKQLALRCYERAHLEEAACLRALCQSEVESMRALGLKNSICIVPNGFDLQEVRTEKPEVITAPWRKLSESGQKVLLYLGRIHPKKGLVNLLRAWAGLDKSEAGRQKSDWLLAIAGWEQGGHEAELMKLASALGISFGDTRLALETRCSSTPKCHSLMFLGSQFGEAKAACYANCDAFILPSFSEGLPMAVLEAWAYSKPVLMTPECNLPEGFAADAAIRIEPNTESIVKGLEQLFRTSSSDLRSLGTNGRQLVAERFAWPKIAQEMKSVYEWVLGGGTKPECVIVN